MTNPRKRLPRKVTSSNLVWQAQVAASKERLRDLDNQSLYYSGLLRGKDPAGAYQAGYRRGVADAREQATQAELAALGLMATYYTKTRGF